MPRIVKTVCSHDCPDACSVLVTVEDDGGNPGGARAVQFRGNPEHPVTRGFLCGKVNTYEQIVYSSERVLHPLRRCGPKGEGRFEPRPVKLGRRGDGFVEVRDGLSEGEPVVTSANFLIDAESNLKAALKSFAEAGSPQEKVASSGMKDTGEQQ